MKKILLPFILSFMLLCGCCPSSALLSDTEPLEYSAAAFTALPDFVGKDLGYFNKYSFSEIPATIVYQGTLNAHYVVRFNSSSEYNSNASTLVSVFNNKSPSASRLFTQAFLQDYPVKGIRFTNGLLSASALSVSFDLRIQFYGVKDVFLSPNIFNFESQYFKFDIFPYVLPINVTTNPNTNPLFFNFEFMYSLPTAANESPIASSFVFNLPSLNYFSRLVLEYNVNFGTEDAFYADTSPVKSRSDITLYGDDNRALYSYTDYSALSYSNILFDNPIQNSKYSLSSTTSYTLPFNATSDTSIQDYGVRLFFVLGGFNIYADQTDSVVSGVAAGAPDYENCRWYDIPCHLGNALLYFMYKFPLTKGIYELINGFYTFITETFGFVALWSGLGVIFSVLMVFFMLSVIRKFTS